MKTNRFLLLLALPMLMLAGCSKDAADRQQTADGRITFKIGFAGQDAQTRVATDKDFNSTFEDGDQIGIFAVEHGQTLAASGNPLNNVKLTCNAGTWSGDAYWPDGAGALDFYAYYPYDANATDPTAIAFNVKADQSAAADYGDSDLLTALSNNSNNGWTEGETVSLKFTHSLTMVQLTIDETADEIDFTKGVTVTLQGVKTAAALDLSAGTNGEAVADGDAANITMHRVEQPDDANYGTSFTYRALVPPQTVAAETKLFRIDSDGQTLTSDALTADLTLNAADAEKLTLKVGENTTQWIGTATQSDALAQGTAGVVSYTIPCANIVENTESSITWYDNAEGTTQSAATPTGVTAVVANTGITSIGLTLNVTGYAEEGTCYFRCSAGGVTSGVMKLVIGPQGSTTSPTINSVTTSGTAPDGNIVVTFSKAMNTESGTVKILRSSNDAETLTNRSWNDSKTVLTLPYSGLDAGTMYAVHVSSFFDTNGNLMLASELTPFVTAGDGAPRSFTVAGTQSGKIIAGAGGKVAFDFTTTGMPAGMFSITLSGDNLPAGVDVDGLVVINTNAGSMIITVPQSVAAGVYNLTASIVATDLTAPFTLTVSEAVPVGTNVNETGSVYYVDGEAVGVVFRAKTGTKPGLVVSLTESADVQWAATDFATLATDTDSGAANMTTVQTYLTFNTGISWDDLPPFNYVVSTMNGQTSWDAGRDKWYLPSFNEMRELAAAFSGKNYEDIADDWAFDEPMPGYRETTADIAAQNTFNATLMSVGGSPLDLSSRETCRYWTSTEYSTNSGTAAAFHFRWGYGLYFYKNNTARARAILAY